MHDIIIVGGGPAGLTAAIYGLRAGKTVLVSGSGNVAVLSGANRMELLPFAQIVTRSCGALMLTIGGILVQLVG